MMPTYCICHPAIANQCADCVVIEFIETTIPFPSERQVVKGCFAIRPNYVKRVYANYLAALRPTNSIDPITRRHLLLLQACCEASKAEPVE